MSEKMSVYINPLTDFGFKYLFGRDADKEFIISFLNAVGIGGDEPIVSVEFIDKEKKGESKEDRAVFYLAGDIYAQGEKGEGWKQCL